MSARLCISENIFSIYSQTEQTLTQDQLLFSQSLQMFCAEATNGYALCGMTLGRLVGTTLNFRCFTLFSKVFGETKVAQITARAFAKGIGLFGEGSAFHLAPGFLQTGTLLQPGSLQGSLSSTLTIASCQAITLLGIPPNLILQHMAQNCAILGAHEVSATFGWVEKEQGCFLQRFIRTEISNWQISAGVCLTQVICPNVTYMEASIHLQMKLRTTSFKKDSGIRKGFQKIRKNFQNIFLPELVEGSLEDLLSHEAKAQKQKQLQFHCFSKAVEQREVDILRKIDVLYEILLQVEEVSKRDFFTIINFYLEKEPQAAKVLTNTSFEDFLKVVSLKDSEGKTIFRKEKYLGYGGGIRGVIELLKIGADLDEVARLVTEIQFEDGKTVFCTPRNLVRFLEYGGNLDYARTAMEIRDHEGKQIFEEQSIELCKQKGYSISQLRSLVEVKTTKGDTIFSKGGEIAEALGRDQFLISELISLRNTEGHTVFRDGEDINRFLNSKGTVESAKEYLSIHIGSQTAFNGLEIVTLQEHNVPAKYAREMVASGLNADTITYYFELGLSKDDIYFKKDGRPKALILFPADNPFDKNFNITVFNDKNSIKVLSTIKDHYDIQLRVISTVEEMYSYLDIDSDIQLLMLGGHGSQSCLAFGPHHSKYGKIISDHSRKLSLNRRDLADHLQQLPPHAVIFLFSCSNGEGREGADNLANYVASSAPGRKVISATDPFHTGYINFSSFFPLSIQMRKIGFLEDVTYIPQNGYAEIIFFPNNNLQMPIAPQFLQYSTTRNKLKKRIEQADANRSDKNAASKIMDEIMQEFAFELIERRDYSDDYRIDYSDLNYIFYTRFHQPWGVGSTIYKTLFPAQLSREKMTPLSFLISQGFRVVTKPQNGDLVVYIDTRLPYFPEYYGIYDDGKIISKLRYGHVVRHEVDLVISDVRFEINGFFYMRIKAIIE